MALKGLLSFSGYCAVSNPEESARKISFCLGSQSCQSLDTEKSCDSNDPQEGRGGSVSLLNGKSPPEVKYILHAPPLNYS